MTQGRVVVVGGGVLGTCHAWLAVKRGLEEVHLEADAEPRAATVRSFGMVWVSGRAPGGELHAARQARRAWEQIAREVPDIGFRADGSLTVVVDEAHRAVLEEVCARRRLRQGCRAARSSLGALAQPLSRRQVRGGAMVQARCRPRAEARAAGLAAPP